MYPANRQAAAERTISASARMQSQSSLSERSARSQVELSYRHLICDPPEQQEFAGINVLRQKAHMVKIRGETYEPFLRGQF